MHLARRLFISNNATGGKRIAATRTGVSNLVHGIIRKGYLRIIGSAINVSQNRSLRLFPPGKRFINAVLSIYRLRLLRQLLPKWTAAATIIVLRDSISF